MEHMARFTRWVRNKKATVFLYSVWVLGLELSLVSTLGSQSSGALSLIRNLSVGCRYCLPGLQLPSQSQRITAIWLLCHIALVGDKGSRVWTICPQSLHHSRRPFSHESDILIITSLCHSNVWHELFVTSCLQLSEISTHNLPSTVVKCLQLASPYGLLCCHCTTEFISSSLTRFLQRHDCHQPYSK